MWVWWIKGEFLFCVYYFGIPLAWIGACETAAENCSKHGQMLISPLLVHVLGVFWGLWSFRSSDSILWIYLPWVFLCVLVALLHSVAWWKKSCLLRPCSFLITCFFPAPHKSCWQEWRSLDLSLDVSYWLVHVRRIRRKSCLFDSNWVRLK